MDLRNVAPAEGFKLPTFLGRQPIKFIKAEAKESSKNNPMISWQIMLMNEDANGAICFGNWLTTDVKGAGFSRKQMEVILPMLGYDINNDTPSDEEIADKLLDLEAFADFKTEPIKDQDDKGRYSVTRKEWDDAAGKEVVVRRLVLKNFYGHDAGGQQANPNPAMNVGQAPNAAPQGYGAPPPAATPPAPVTHYQQQGAPAAPPQQAQGGAVPPWLANQQQAQGGQPPPAAPVTRETQATRGRGGRGAAAK